MTSRGFNIRLFGPTLSIIAIAAGSSGCRFSAVLSDRIVERMPEAVLPEPTTAPRPNVTVTPTPKPSATPLPSATPKPTPVISQVLLHEFPFALAEIPIRNQQMWVPSPWIADYSGPNSLEVISNRTALQMTIRDGAVWEPLYDFSSAINYARSEISLRGSPYLLDGKTYIIEWKGYLNQDLPVIPYDDSYKSAILPIQIHNGKGSPRYAINVRAPDRSISLAIVDPTAQKIEKWVKLDSTSAFVRVPRTIRITIKPSLYAGLFRLELDGKLIYEQSTGMTSPTPGHDFVKFGIYDFNRLLVDPANPKRGRVFSLTTLSFKVFAQGSKSP